MLLIVGSSVLASEQIPVRIVPAEPISTVHDEVQLGDNIMFKVQNDVYLNDKLIFTKDALVFGTVDKIEDNQDGTDEIEEPWRQQLLDALMKMNARKFELFCRGLLTKMGVDVDDEKGVQYVADGGIDGFGYVRSDDYRTTRVALQAKRWQGKVSAPEIDKFRGAMDKFNAEFGIFITNY